MQSKFWIIVIAIIVSINLVSCTSKPYPKFENLSEKEIADQLFLDLKNKQYKNVEEYFDYLIKEKVKNRDGLQSSWLIYKELGTKKNESHLDILDTWCNTSSHYSALVTRGEYHIQDAWIARGTHLAKYVKKEQFALFHERLELAHKDFEKAYILNQNDPNIAARMLTVVRGLSLGLKAREMWFHRGVKADPSFYRIYQNKLLALYPKWGGSWEESYGYVKSLHDNPPQGSLADTLMLDWIIECFISNIKRIKDSTSEIEQIVLDIDKAYKAEYPNGTLTEIKKERILGSINFLYDKTNDAEKHFKRIIEVDPQYDWAWYMLGQMYNKSLNTPLKAIEFFNKAIDLNKEEGLYYQERGSAYVRLGKHNECINDLEFAKEKGYGDSFTHNILAISYGEIGDFEKGLKNVNIALEISDKGNPLQTRASLYYKKGELEKSLADYEVLAERYQSSIYKEKIDKIKDEIMKRNKQQSI